MALGPVMDLLLTYLFGYQPARGYWLANETNRFVAACVARYGFWIGGLIASLPLFAMIPIALAILMAALRNLPPKWTRITLLGFSFVLLALKVAAGLTWFEWLNGLPRLWF